MECNLSLSVNGQKTNLTVPAQAILTDVLRVQLGLTSVKKGCETGECGACAVLINGKLVNSCIILAPMVDGTEITTVEGLSVKGLSEIQEALVEFHGTQCGFCTPGVVLAAKALLAENSHPSREEIARALSGNLCRCTGYVNQIKAISHIAASRP